MVTKHYDRLPAEAIKGRAKALSMDALVKNLTDTNKSVREADLFSRMVHLQRHVSALRDAARVAQTYSRGKGSYNETSRITHALQSQVDGIEAVCKVMNEAARRGKSVYGSLESIPVTAFKQSDSNLRVGGNAFPLSNPAEEIQKIPAKTHRRMFDTLVKTVHMNFTMMQKKLDAQYPTLKQEAVELRRKQVAQKKAQEALGNAPKERQKASISW